MPWNSPSSQPTSWACAIRSSASDGTSSPNGRVMRSSSSISSGARPSSSWLLDEVGGVAGLLVVAGLVGHPHTLLGDHDDPPALVVVSRALLLIAGCVHGAHPAPSAA